MRASDSDQGLAVREKKDNLDYDSYRVSGSSRARPGAAYLNQLTSPRICLRCNKSFPSAGIGNRICVRCDEMNSHLTKRECSQPHALPPGVPAADLSDYHG